MRAESGKGSQILKEIFNILNAESYFQLPWGGALVPFPSNPAPHSCLRLTRVWVSLEETNAFSNPHPANMNQTFIGLKYGEQGDTTMERGVGFWFRSTLKSIYQDLVLDLEVQTKKKFFFSFTVWACHIWFEVPPLQLVHCLWAKCSPSHSKVRDRSQKKKTFIGFSSTPQLCADGIRGSRAEKVRNNKKKTSLWPQMDKQRLPKIARPDEKVAKCLVRVLDDDSPLLRRNMRTPQTKRLLATPTDSQELQEQFILDR